ncbi:MAG: hypothetical protein R2705_02340 [Ilumatobacteraceae bacterium]
MSSQPLGVGEAKWVNAVLGVVAWLVGFLYFFPILWMGLNSFKEEIDANTAPTLQALHAHARALPGGHRHHHRPALVRPGVRQLDVDRADQHPDRAGPRRPGRSAA